jgi:hypothetical protein
LLSSVFVLLPFALQALSKFIFHLPHVGGAWSDRQLAIASFVEQTAACASSQPSADLNPTEVVVVASKAAEAMLGTGQEVTLQGTEQAVV